MHRSGVLKGASDDEARGSQYAGEERDIAYKKRRIHPLGTNKRLVKTAKPPFLPLLHPLAGELAKHLAMAWFASLHGSKRLSLSFPDRSRGEKQEKRM